MEDDIMYMTHKPFYNRKESRRRLITNNKFVRLSEAARITSGKGVMTPTRKKVMRRMVDHKLGVR